MGWAGCRIRCRGSWLAWHSGRQLAAWRRLYGNTGGICSRGLPRLVLPCHRLSCCTPAGSPPPPPNAVHRSVLLPACKMQRCLCTGEKGVGRSGKPLHFKGSTFHRVIPQARVFSNQAAREFIV